MQINSTPSTAPTSPLTSVSKAAKAYGAQAPQQAAPARAADRLELSGASHLLQTAKASDVRLDKVAALKAQIEAGTYDLDAKADAVADRLMDDLGL